MIGHLKKLFVLNSDKALLGGWNTVEAHMGFKWVECMWLRELV